MHEHNPNSDILIVLSCKIISNFRIINKNKRPPKEKPNLTQEQEDFMRKRKEAEKEFKKKMKEKVAVEKDSDIVS